MKFTKKTACRYALALAAGALIAPSVIPTVAPAQSDMPATSSMGMMPTSVSGMIVRQYVDTMGNISAVDVQAADGVQQVRFTPAVAPTDARFAGLGKGNMADLTGMITPGINTYSPEGSPRSGLMMNGSMTTGTSGAMSALSGIKVPVTTLDLSRATSPPSQYGALVSLPDGRVTVIRQMDGKMYYVHPDNGKLHEVASDNMMMPAGKKTPKGTRVMTLSPDGTMINGTIGTDASGRTMPSSSTATDMTAISPK